MVQLIPMSADDLTSYLEQAIPRYAEEHIKAQLWETQTAYKQAHQTILERLPEGINTRNHYLYCIQRKMDTETIHVGYLWFTIESHNDRREAFILDMMIDSKFRRRGYGADAFEQVEAKVRELGIDTISLQLFGNNRGAQALYESLGFATSSIQMIKHLAQPESAQNA